MSNTWTQDVPLVAFPTFTNHEHTFRTKKVVYERIMTSTRPNSYPFGLPTHCAIAASDFACSLLLGDLEQTFSTYVQVEAFFCRLT
jgi:hypothetical protein